MIKCPAGNGFADRVPNPDHLAVDHCDIRADVFTGQQRHPKMARCLPLQIFRSALQCAAAHPHTAEVDDRLTEYRVACGFHPMRKKVGQNGSGATRDISIEMKPVVLRTYFYASAIAHSAFRDQSWRRGPRPNENCPLRIRCASSMPAIVMAAFANDLNPAIDAQRRLIAR